MLGYQLSAASKAWSLADSIYRRRKAYVRWKNRIRFSLMAGSCPEESLEWFSKLEEPGMHPFISKMPMLVFKPMRAYLSIRWDMAQRKKVIWET